MLEANVTFIHHRLLVIFTFIRPVLFAQHPYCIGAYVTQQSSNGSLRSERCGQSPRSQNATVRHRIRYNVYESNLLIVFTGMILTFYLSMGFSLARAIA